MTEIKRNSEWYYANQDSLASKYDGKFIAASRFSHTQSATREETRQMKTSTAAAAIAAMVCVMTSPLAAKVAALSVAVSGNDVSVSVPAGVLDETSGIYLVRDTDDHGSNLENWPADCISSADSASSFVEVVKS